MDVTCPKCNAQYSIPDEKLPKGKVVAMTCSKCKQKITIDTRNQPASGDAGSKASAASGKNGLLDEINGGSYDAADKPFDYVEKGAKTALLCETDLASRAAIRAGVEHMGYNVTEAQSARDALKQMRFHVFDMVVINENFDTDDPDNNHVIKYLSRLAISIRRHMFLALLTERFRTMDNMAAFTKSVNVIINLKNLDEVHKVLGTALSDHGFFYNIFFETAGKIGKF